MKEKKIDINKIVDKIKKKFGEDSIMTLNHKKSLGINIESVSTGCKELDNILEIGGIPKGRIVEIFGVESSGKTTLCLHIIKEFQKKGEVVAFIDAEHALDIKYASNIGVDFNRLLFNQPEYGERALDITEELIKTKKVALVVIDSVAALTPKKEIEGDMESKNIGLQARMMGQALRKLIHLIKTTNTSIIFINQLRDKIGVMFGEKTVTPGGRSLKFFSHLRIGLARIKTLKSGIKKMGILVRATIKKSKISVPFKTCEFEIRFGKGITK